MVVFRLINVLCLVIPWVIVTTTDITEASPTECESLLTSVRIEVSSVMLYAICRDNQTTSLVVGCGNDIWYEKIKGFCNSFDLNIGQSIMRRPLMSPTITLQLVKAGETLDAARVVIITSEHLSRYRISVWGHLDTRFLLSITRACPSTAEDYISGRSPMLKKIRRRNSSKTTPLISSVLQPTGSTLDRVHSTVQPRVSDDADPTIPEYLRPNKLAKPTWNSQGTASNHDSLTPLSKQYGLSATRNLTELDTYRSKLPNSSASGFRPRNKSRSSYKKRTRDFRRTTTPISSEFAKLQWMEDKRLLFEQKLDFLRNFNPDEPPIDFSTPAVNEQQSLFSQETNAEIVPAGQKHLQQVSQYLSEEVEPVDQNRPPLEAQTVHGEVEPTSQTPSQQNSQYLPEKVEPKEQAPSQQDSQYFYEKVESVGQNRSHSKLQTIHEEVEPTGQTSLQQESQYLSEEMEPTGQAPLQDSQYFYPDVEPVGQNRSPPKPQNVHEEIESRPLQQDSQQSFLEEVEPVSQIPLQQESQYLYEEMEHAGQAQDSQYLYDEVESENPSPWQQKLDLNEEVELADRAPLQEGSEYLYDEVDSAGQFPFQKDSHPSKEVEPAGQLPSQQKSQNIVEEVGSADPKALQQDLQYVYEEMETVDQLPSQPESQVPSVDDANSALPTERQTNHLSVGIQPTSRSPPPQDPQRPATAEELDGRSPFQQNVKPPIEDFMYAGLLRRDPQYPSEDVGHSSGLPLEQDAHHHSEEVKLVRGQRRLQPDPRQFNVEVTPADHFLPTPQHPSVQVVSTSQLSQTSQSPKTSFRELKYRHLKGSKMRVQRNSNVEKDLSPIFQPFNHSSLNTDEDELPSPRVPVESTVDEALADTEITKTIEEHDDSNLSIVDFVFPKAGQFKVFPNSTTIPAEAETTTVSDASAPAGGIPLFLPIAPQSSEADDTHFTDADLPSKTTSIVSQTIFKPHSTVIVPMLTTDEQQDWHKSSEGSGLQSTQSIVWRETLIASTPALNAVEFTPTTEILTQVQLLNSLSSHHTADTILTSSYKPTVSLTSITDNILVTTTKQSYSSLSGETISKVELVTSTPLVLSSEKDQISPTPATAWPSAPTSVSQDSHPVSSTGLQETTSSISPSVSSVSIPTQHSDGNRTTAATIESSFTMSTSSLLTSSTVRDAAREASSFYSSTTVIAASVKDSQLSSSSIAVLPTVPEKKNPSLVPKLQNVSKASANGDGKPIQTPTLPDVSSKTTPQMHTSQTSELLTTSGVPFSTVTPLPSDDQEDKEGINEDSFWPVVAALVIGIPAVIVFGIAITVIHRRRTPDPSKFFNMKALRMSHSPSASSVTMRSETQQPASDV